MTERNRGSIKCEIVERIGQLNSYPTGWTKEFNVVKWNDKPEKYDIRDWSPGHERMSRGITLREEELLKLKEFCDKRFGCCEEPAGTDVTVIVTDRTEGTQQENIPQDASDTDKNEQGLEDAVPF